MAGMAANNDIEQYVHQLSNPATRENALLELSKKRENFPELAPYLWYSFGTVAALLQEIVSIYPLLTPPSLTAHASNRVCNALALLQCVASHPETRGLFLQGGRVQHIELHQCKQPDGVSSRALMRLLEHLRPTAQFVFFFFGHSWLYRLRRICLGTEPATCFVLSIWLLLLLSSLTLVCGLPAVLVLMCMQLTCRCFCTPSSTL